MIIAKFYRRNEVPLPISLTVFAFTAKKWLENLLCSSNVAEVDLNKEHSFKNPAKIR